MCLCCVFTVCGRIVLWVYCLFAFLYLYAAFASFVQGGVMYISYLILGDGISYYETYHRMCCFCLLVCLCVPVCYSHRSVTEGTIPLFTCNFSRVCGFVDVSVARWTPTRFDFLAHFNNVPQSIMMFSLELNRLNRRCWKMLLAILPHPAASPRQEPLLLLCSCYCI